MTPNQLPSAEYLRKTFSYCPFSGWLRWRVREDVNETTNIRFAGKVVGTISSNGFMVRLNGQSFSVNRIIYTIMEGDVLTKEDIVEHEDLNQYNNKWYNLRIADKSQNGANRDAQCNNLIGIKGVGQLSSGKFRARLNNMHLGCFDTKEEAIEAYNIAAASIYGEFGRPSSLPKLI